MIGAIYGTFDMDNPQPSEVWHFRGIPGGVLIFKVLGDLVKEITGSYLGVSYFTENL